MRLGPVLLASLRSQLHLLPSTFYPTTGHLLYVPLPAPSFLPAAACFLLPWCDPLLPTYSYLLPLSASLSRYFLSDLYEARHAPVHSAAHASSAPHPTAAASCAMWQAAVGASSSLAARLPTSTELMDVRHRLLGCGGCEIEALPSIVPTTARRALPRACSSLHVDLHAHAPPHAFAS